MYILSLIRVYDTSLAFNLANRLLKGELSDTVWHLCLVMLMRLDLGLLLQIMKYLQQILKQRSVLIQIFQKFNSIKLMIYWLAIPNH